ncbi:MAG TPA: ankyrin repeat domain-containing protein [Beijerinckiaceae bacterium]|nr:ankyrin repeat domain-containing protein [Beijerinckiaceae bacterium]
MLAAFRQPIALALLLVALVSTTPAQTPPSPAELEAYRGFHAAAARGGVEEIRRLAAAGADLNARDGSGRTPLHVAAFLGQPDAARALLAAKADPARPPALRRRDDRRRPRRRADGQDAPRARREREAHHQRL